jgi:uncharacterized membrane protein
MQSFFTAHDVIISIVLFSAFTALIVYARNYQKARNK